MIDLCTNMLNSIRLVFSNPIFNLNGFYVFLNIFSKLLFEKHLENSVLKKM